MSATPELIRPRRLELTVHQIRCRSAVRIAHGRDYLASTAFTSQPLSPHQAAHALGGHRLTVILQLRVHTRAAVRPVRPLVDLAYALFQLRVALGSRRRPTLEPCIVPAGGDLQHAAHGGNRIHGLVGSRGLGRPRRHRIGLPSEPDRGFCRSPARRATACSRAAAASAPPLLAGRPFTAARIPIRLLHPVAK